MTTTAPSNTVPTDVRLREEFVQVGVVEPAGPLSTSFTFAWRALLKMKHLPEQLFDATLFPVMITLVFTFLFGGAVAGSPGDYLQYALPGILVLGVVLISMYSGVALSTDISRNVYDRFLTLPMWHPSILVGSLLGDVVRYAVSSVAVIAVGLALGFSPEGGALGLLLAALMTQVFAFSIAWVWMVLGQLLETPASVMNTSQMVLFPLAFGSNIFVDPATMPGWLQVFVRANPISLVVAAVRGLVSGTVTAGEVAGALGACAVLVAIFAPLTVVLLARRR